MALSLDAIVWGSLVCIIGGCLVGFFSRLVFRAFTCHRFQCFVHLLHHVQQPGYACDDLSCDCMGAIQELEISMDILGFSDFVDAAETSGNGPSATLPDYAKEAAKPAIDLCMLADVVNHTTSEFAGLSTFGLAVVRECVHPIFGQPASLCNQQHFIG